MTDKQLLKQALEALEADSISVEKYESLVTAIKQALAAPVQPSDELERERALELSCAYQDGYERAIQNTTPFA